MNTEITLAASELKQALPGLSKIVGRSRTLPVLQTVRITRDGAGKVSILATDLDSFATYTANWPGTGRAGHSSTTGVRPAVIQGTTAPSACSWRRACRSR